MVSVLVSCQTIALPTGVPVRRSHSTVVSRWLVMPTPTATDLTGDGVGRAEHLGDQRGPRHLALEQGAWRPGDPDGGYDEPAAVPDRCRDPGLAERVLLAFARPSAGADAFQLGDDVAASHQRPLRVGGEHIALQ